jgi:ABC-type sugar transport system ATPase subunit
VVVTGHEIDEMLDWCTRVMVLDGGRIAALFRTSDFERAELTERIDRLLAGPPGGKEAPA